MKLIRVGTDLPNPVQKLDKTITFTGGAGAGAVGTVTVFTISGIINVIRLIPYCTDSLISAGGGNISLGRTGGLTSLIGATVATALDVGHHWTTTTPSFAFVALPALFNNSLYNSTVLIDVTVADVTAGTIVFHLEYTPISAGATIS